MCSEGDNHISMEVVMHDKEYNAGSYICLSEGRAHSREIASCVAKSIIAFTHDGTF